MSQRTRTTLIFAFTFAHCLSAAERVYLGTYTAKDSKGIYMAQFNPDTGTLSAPELAASLADPSFLAQHPTLPVLYAVSEGQGTVAAFSVASPSGALALINLEETGGAGPCHLAVDGTGKMLAVANYGGGSFSVFPIQKDGRLGKRSAFVQFTGSGPDKSRQEAPHAHSITFTADNRFMLVDDLGTDRVMIYRIHPETATVEAADPPFASDNPGAGPRHLSFGPEHRFVYVLNEMGSSVTRFRFDATAATMQKMDTVSALPPDFHGSNTAAEIVVDRKGQRLYTSNRGNDSIAVFHIDSAGALNRVQDVPSGGRQPRSFSLDSTGKWLLAANQEGDNIQVFSVDGASGHLTSTGQKPAQLSKPVCVLFWKQ